jgi:uncharacterized protein (TIGR03437 family)
MGFVILYRILLLALAVNAGVWAQSITATPARLSHAFPSNSIVPFPLQVALEGFGAIAVSATTQSGGNWLSVSPASGSAPARLDVTLDPSGLPDGTYLATITITQGTAPTAVPVIAMVGNPGPQVSQAGVVNAASYQGGVVSPGEILTLFGSAIGPRIAYGARVQDGTLVSKLAATRVWFDNISAPLIYAYPDQVAAIVPFEVAGKSSVQVQVENLVARTPPFSLKVQDATPAFFTADASGKGQLAALNQDGSYNAPSSPAAKGSIVVLYATGAGTMKPQPANGEVIATTPLPAPLLPVQLTIGGQKAEILYSGAAPQLVAGVLQINARVPAAVASGASPVVLTVGTFSSPGDCTISVQ